MHSPPPPLAVFDYAGLKSRIDTEIADLLRDGKPESLYSPLRHALNQTKAKRLRPCLTIAAGIGCGANLEAVIPAALAVEIFHGFTLMHDDIMDESKTRRGVPTVAAKFGRNAAILSGDAAYAICWEQLSRLPESANMQKAFEVFASASLEVCRGQQWDMDFEERDSVSMSEYKGMISQKTGALLGAALALGALGAGRDQGIAGLLQLGEDIGVAFQLQDDYLDAFGGHATGKIKGGDIRRNKRTWLWVKAREVADEQTLHRLIQAEGLSDPEQRVSQTLALYEALELHLNFKKTLNDLFASIEQRVSVLSWDMHGLRLFESLLSAMRSRNY